LCRLRSAVNDQTPETPKLLKERKKGEKKTRTEVLRVSNPNFAKEGRKRGRVERNLIIALYTKNRRLIKREHKNTLNVTPCSFSLSVSIFLSF
jgi:hypothetical protein